MTNSSINTKMILSALSVGRRPKPGGSEKLKGADTLCTSILWHSGDHSCSLLLACLAQCLLGVFFSSLLGQGFWTKCSCGQIIDYAISRATALAVAPLCSSSLTSGPAGCHSYPASGCFFPLPSVRRASVALLRPTQDLQQARSKPGLPFPLPFNSHFQLSP